MIGLGRRAVSGDDGPSLIRPEWGRRSRPIGGRSIDRTDSSPATVLTRTNGARPGSPGARVAEVPIKASCLPCPNALLRTLAFDGGQQTGSNRRS